MGIHVIPNVGQPLPDDALEALEQVGRIANPFLTKEPAPRWGAGLTVPGKSWVGKVREDEQGDPWVLPVEHMGEVEPGGTIPQCDVNEGAVGIEAVDLVKRGGSSRSRGHTESLRGEALLQERSRE